MAAAQLHPKPDLEMMEKAIVELGFKGIRFVPAVAWFYPDDYERLDPVYRKAIELDVPVRWHIGDSGLRAANAAYASMERLADVVHRYTDLKHLIAHLGGFAQEGIEHRVIEFATSRPNVYIEASAAPRAAMIRNFPMGTAPLAQRYTTDFLYAEEWSPEVRSAWDEVRDRQVRIIRQPANACPERFLFASDAPFAISQQLGFDLHKEALGDSALWDRVMVRSQRTIADSRRF